MDPLLMALSLSYNNDNLETSYNNHQTDYVTLFFILFSSLYFSTIMISLWDNYDSNEEDIDEHYRDIEEYKKKYIEEFSSLEEKDHSKDFLNSLKDKFIHEETPMGDIIMTYNIDFHSFWYYADRKSIPYGILDAVARKLAIENDCKSICINYIEEYEKAKEKFTEDNEQQENERENERENELENEQDKNIKSVFATFKSYNKTKKVKPEKKHIMVDKANRFTCKGNTVEWHNIQDEKKQKTKIDEKIKDLNFSTFKMTYLKKND
tara:strand:- start:484 stop:1278 length:795 start_codon:yes stop_codon:yes gene_type:complete